MTDNKTGVKARRWKLPVVGNLVVDARHRELVLRAPELAATLRPGQFVNVLATDMRDPLLRRPFSVYRMDHAAGTISLLYDLVGRGTGLMSLWEPGFEADVLAPLGNWFTVPEGNGPLALVAGGIGVAPLVAFAAEVAPTGRPIYALLGARTADMLLAEKDLLELGVTLRIATDDGSRGHQGFVHTLLEAIIRGEQDAAPVRFDAVLTCGPRPMMAAVARVAAQAGIPCSVSMEVNMACGFGVCMGCAWPVRSGGRPAHGSESGCACASHAPADAPPTYRLVCTDGPVFDAAEVLWEERGGVR